MSEKILFVDDDANLLASCERNLRRQFQIETAEGGEAGLAKIAARGPYAVVISDMQMPGMNGIQFLSAVKERAPDTVRVMLTGNADVEVAMGVVNEGNIFRFLTKPCQPEVLAKALNDALAQHRLVMAEKELLSKTLSGSIKLLTDILSIMDTPSFGRTQILRDAIAEATSKLGLENAWEIHLAVMLAPIGYVTVPAETMVKARAGEVLSKVEEQMVARLPETAARLLANIPRLEGVAKIVHYQHKHFNGCGFPSDSISGEAIPKGARLLKIFWDMFQLQKTGVSRLDALAEMEGRGGWYDPALLASVRAINTGGGEGSVKTGSRTLSVSAKDLKPGMMLHSNVITKDGMMIIAAGHEINQMTLEKIQNFESLSGIQEPIFVTDANVA
ncbi:MAG TPA: HD domain-containing phosphohydrolase [Verrucomicrobiae bacterium]|jgi:response regulator RpfG family c-di-GMP phosphodiesterase|nr:HD domain-containing phosphohydrolase [Verrucomicrobiae bacterium]